MAKQRGQLSAYYASGFIDGIRTELRIIATDFEAAFAEAETRLRSSYPHSQIFIQTAQYLYKIGEETEIP